jgi:hypothetical protein
MLKYTYVRQNILILLLTSPNSPVPTVVPEGDTKSFILQLYLWFPSVIKKANPMATIRAFQEMNNRNKK